MTVVNLLNEVCSEGVMSIDLLASVTPILSDHDIAHAKTADAAALLCCWFIDYAGAPMPLSSDAKIIGAARQLMRM